MEKKIFFLAILAALVVAPAQAVLTPSGVPVHTHASVQQGGSALGAHSVTGTLSSTKACAGGFVRKTPNYCASSSATVLVTWTNSAACTARTTGRSLPADAKVILLRLYWRALALNSANSQRFNNITFSNSATCAAGSEAAFALYNGFEFVATVAGTVIGQGTSTLLVPLVSTDTFYFIQANAGGNGNADIANYSIDGYFD